MSGNSLEQVLARMDKRNITRGWGAVAALSRARLNSLLREQYLQRLSTLRYLPLLNADVDHEDHIRTSSVLRKLEFGVPLLSFSTASLNDSRAELTFPIVAGTYMSRSPLAENLLTRFIIDEAMGYAVVMDIDLSMVTGEIDRRGRVTLDLAQATAFRCNLAGQNAKVNALLAATIEQHFSQLPHHRGRFELGMLDFDGYTPLTPTSFIIRTQPAPGAKLRGAENYGDGAVLTFIQLQANQQPGTPPESSFPYLIPDDLEADDRQRYSAALVLDKDLLGHVTDDRVDVLASLLFPAPYVFVERERHRPHDLAIFGSIETLPDVLSIDPPFAVVRAGERQQFILRDQAGNAVRALAWQASSRQSHSAAGDGTIDSNGLYSSVDAQSIGYHSLTIVITAEHEGRKVTAQLLVKFEPTQVSPRVAVFTPQIPMDLGAVMGGGEAVEWTLMGAPRGQLDRNTGARVSFEPEAEASRRQLSAQAVQALGKENRQSALVMLSGLQTLEVEPARAIDLKYGQRLQLAERDPDLLPDARRRWQLVGAGSLDQDGVFTAPSEGQQGTSVVTCELVRNGVVLAAGYSLLEVGEQEPIPDPTWTNITSYKVYIPGGSNGQAEGVVLNNGFQSLRVQVVIETEKAADGKYYRLSPDERASIGLNFEISKQRLMALSEDDPSEGIEKDDVQRWATRQTPNRFQLAYAQLPQNSLAAGEEQAITRQDIFVHCGERGGVVTALYSSFYADLGGTWASNTSTGENSRLVVTPKDVPAPSAFQYSWERVRVEGGTGAVTDPGDPPFDLHLRTVDYWKLAVLGSRFLTCQFLPLNKLDPSINTSMIRWESENPQEIMFSFTGSVFYDETKVFATTVQFDDDLKKLLNGRAELNTPVNTSAFETGELVISNHRVPDFSWVAPGSQARDRLSRDLAVLLRDYQGNAHYRRISFGSDEKPTDRNRLSQRLFTPV